MVDTTTINTLPSATTASFNSDLQTFLAGEDADRYDSLAGSGHVVSGGLHGTGAGLVGSPSSLTAYPGGYYITETGTITYPDDTTYIYVICHKDQTTSLGGNWTRVSGTYYAYDSSTGASRPSLPADSLWLMDVTTASGAISAVTDRRRLARTQTVILAKTSAPGANDDASVGFMVGDTVVDETNDVAYTCVDSTTGAAVWVSGGGLDNIVEDTSPQLGGDLDLNGKSIDFPSVANVSDCLDEDDMSSDSATALATQQSIKAYVDSATFQEWTPTAGTSSITVTSADNRKYYILQSGNDTTPTLPTLTSALDGMMVGFYNTDGTDFTLTTSGGDTFSLNGQTTLITTRPDEYVNLLGDFTNNEWKVFGHNIFFGFAATPTSNQSVTTDTYTKVANATEVYDPQGEYNNATYRYTPLVGGTYYVGAVLELNTLADTKHVRNAIYKNGALITESREYVSNVSTPSIHVGMIVDMNGSSDYLEHWCYYTDTSGRSVVSGSANTLFYAYRLG